MAEYKMVRLGDYITEYSVKNKSNEDIPVYSVTNTQGFCTEYFSKDVSSKDKSNYKIVPRGCFAYNPSRINVGSVDWQRYEDRVIVSPLYNVFKVSPELENQYLYYFLKSDIGHTLITSKAEGSVRDNLKITMLAEFSIPLPPLETQKLIAAQLDKCTALIAKHKQMLEKYDTLIKSRFIEMFGAPDQNPLNWEISNLGNFIENANNGMARRGNDKNGKIVLRLVELQRGFINYSDCNRIAIKTNEEKYLLKNNDFLFARVNGNPDNVGRCSYYKDIGEEVYHNDHIIRVHFDENRLNEYYLNTLLNSEYGKSEFKKYIKTSAGQYTIAQDGISSAQIPIPPIELQNNFAAFVQQIDKSKFAVQKSLEKAETLYKSLMQRYFA